MWILNYVTKNSINNSPAEKGNIKSASDGCVMINASSDHSKIPIAAPYGISEPSARERTCNQASLCLNPSAERVLP